MEETLLPCLVPSNWRDVTEQTVSSRPGAAGASPAPQPLPYSGWGYLCIKNNFHNKPTRKILSFPSCQWGNRLGKYFAPDHIARKRYVRVETKVCMPPSPQSVRLTAFPCHITAYGRWMWGPHATNPGRTGEAGLCSHKDPRLPKNSKPNLERQELSHSRQDGQLLSSLGQLAPCLFLACFHVMSSTRSRGTSNVSSGTVGCYCVWSRVRKGSEGT